MCVRVRKHMCAHVHVFSRVLLVFSLCFVGVRVFVSICYVVFCAFVVIYRLALCFCFFCGFLHLFISFVLCFFFSFFFLDRVLV